MVAPFLIPLASSVASLFAGKAVGKSEGEEKIEILKEVVGLTPDQVEAVEAVRRMPLKELRDRRELGIGPLSPLPAQASERARAIRQARIDVASGVSVTPEEKASVAAAPDQASALKALVDKKVAEARAAALRR